jgi:cation:H+ antiporter
MHVQRKDARRLPAFTPTIILFICGVALLILGAEFLVRGAARLALAVGISPLVVGLTVVAFGTSSPEVAVSVQAALSARDDLAVGNVVGSNIFNVLFILGASALIAPLVVARQLVRQEVPIMIGTSLLLGALCLDGRVSFADGLLLISLLIVYAAFVIVQSRRALADAAGAGVEAPGGSGSKWDRHWSVQVLLVIGGLALLALGARWLVDASISFARHLGVSELVIGLTIVAAGTSLPEVATSLVAAIRGQRDIAVGNVVGSNIFNILGVLGISAAAAPAGLAVAPALPAFDLPLMIAVALACLPIFFTGHLIARWEGVLFLGLYGAYTVYVLLAAQDHDALEPFSAVMLYSVLPVIALTLALVAWREWRARRAGANRA